MQKVLILSSIALMPNVIGANARYHTVRSEIADNRNGGVWCNHEPLRPGIRRSLYTELKYICRVRRN
jgi:hypothetical protein